MRKKKKRKGQKTERTFFSNYRRGGLVDRSINMASIKGWFILLNASTDWPTCESCLTFRFFLYLYYIYYIILYILYLYQDFTFSYSAQLISLYYLQGEKKCFFSKNSEFSKMEKVHPKKIKKIVERINRKKERKKKQ